MIKELIPNLLVYLTLISDMAIVLIIVFAIYLKIQGKSFRSTEYGLFLRKNYLLFGFIVSLGAMLGSLFYSEIMGYAPCVLCWYQRIFMYPQAFIFAFAMWKKDKRIATCSLMLSIIGGLIALYHYIFQIGFLGVSGICDIIGYSSSCSEAFFTNLGYLTIPMMAFTAFVLLIILGIVSKK